MIRKNFPKQYNCTLSCVLGLKDSFLLRANSICKFLICDHLGKIKEKIVRWKHDDHETIRNIGYSFGYESLGNKKIILSEYGPYYIDEDGYIWSDCVERDNMQNYAYSGFYRTGNLICFSKLNRRISMFLSREIIEQIESNKEVNFHILNLKTQKLTSYDLPLVPFCMAITANEMTAFVSTSSEYLIFDLDES